jgi:hypothetical protein
MPTTPTKPPGAAHAGAPIIPREERSDNCYCSALPSGSGPCLPCYGHWLRLSEAAQRGEAHGNMVDDADRRYRPASLIKEEIRDASEPNRGPNCPKSGRRDDGAGEAITRPVAVIRRTTRI